MKTKKATTKGKKLQRKSIPAVKNLSVAAYKRPGGR